MRFKVGQEVVCTNKFGWVDDETGCPTPGPRFNEVVTFIGFDGADYIILKEYEFATSDIEPDSYSAGYFEPLVSDEKLNEELEILSESKTLEQVEI